MFHTVYVLDFKNFCYLRNFMSEDTLSYRCLYLIPKQTQSKGHSYNPRKIQGVLAVATLLSPSSRWIWELSKQSIRVIRIPRIGWIDYLMAYIPNRMLSTLKGPDLE